MKSQVPVDDADPRRTTVRDWLREHPDPTPRQLADAGYVAPHWPVPWGQGADPMTQLIIEDELQRHAVKVPLNPNGVLFTGPSLLIGGTAEQQQRYLPPMLAGEEMWCRLYSEPDAGSDLTAIRSRAQRHGDVFVVNGWKLWAPLAQSAVLGGLLVRTGGKPGDADGLTYIVCPMDTPGITIRRVRDMAGGSRFNEIIFDDVELPAENVVGDVDAGLVVADSRHHFERVSFARGVSFGLGAAASDLLNFAKDRQIVRDPQTRDRVAQAWTQSEILRLLAISVAGSRARGCDTDLVERARKILLERHGRDLGLLSCDLLGAQGTLGPEPGDASSTTWYNAFLGAPAITLGAGTTELQLDALGSRLLGL